MDKVDKINQAITRFYQGKQAVSEHLIAAIRYSAEAGGKRIRPLLLLELLEAFSVTLTDSHYDVAAALEMIHTGSLIHDDLPAMDNDDYRRGRLTNHKKFDEATAILAGDSLFLDAFALIAETNLSANIKVDLMHCLSHSSGTFGMVGGQMLDMKAEGQELALTDLQEIHRHKTGCLLAYPFWAAAKIADVDEEILLDLYQAGLKVGHAFQVRDDILDVTADFTNLGKTPQKDLTAEKMTYPRLLGLDESYRVLNEDIDQSIAILEALRNKLILKPDNIICLIERLRLNA
ncbi:polyprenyl synthetase family protein [Streptococcus pseudoporcinus]|uniref:Farnesyl diphosphate synthase n=1 Tax=Streptococcus pseudoporcinus LQ 940-04 TaxID=875093 RepID=G5K901_9STRE|nr:farnesyl diphosphate synthase [Streptococcus pseudoporcinus]EFR43950.1 polyprenyl synthetase [Streptococcus pseudoporcinus SPIN 20026]EHI64300.1 polyprenyl synthetase [Streptococcus pseudoporcinus LQ 940-04]VEF93404.1 geranyltranstransferase [Streptococcus pseudoporcinus]